MTEEALPDTIDQELMKWALLHQKNCKAVGPDGLPVELIKNQVCCTFFQSLFSACLFPQFGIMEVLPQYQRTKQVTLESHLTTEEYLPYKAFCSILNQVHPRVGRIYRDPVRGTKWL